MPSGRPRAPWENLRDRRLGEPGSVRHGRGKRTYRTTEFRTYNALKKGLEALKWIQQKRTVLCSRREVPTKGSPVGEGESLSWKGRVDDRQRSVETGGGIEKEGAGMVRWTDTGREE